MDPQGIRKLTIKKTMEMKCSTCGEEGHKKNSRKFHPSGTIDKTHESPHISRSEAEKSADEFMPYIREWLIRAIMDPNQHRDIGKLLANPSEIVAMEKLNRMTPCSSRIVVGESYDMTSDSVKPVRTQVKFRMGDWHLETTRRNSAKNVGTNSTGHVAYRRDEFDMLTVFVPGPNFGIEGSKICCIPSSELINPKKPDQLVTRIPAAIRNKYSDDDKTQEVIRMMFQTPS